MKLESKAKKDIQQLEARLGEKATKKIEKIRLNLKKIQTKFLNKKKKELAGAFHSFEAILNKNDNSKPGAVCKDLFNEKYPKLAYESRVLEGIWAAAPYLHNGSVPTLADLLKPVAERPVSFKIGSNYDIVNVGLAVEQTQFDYTLTTTGCDQLNSGNSRCGHEYGTKLTPKEKEALVEYMKTL
jgi:hypothetical protein